MNKWYKTGIGLTSTSVAGFITSFILNYERPIIPSQDVQDLLRINAKVQTQTRNPYFTHTNITQLLEQRPQVTPELITEHKKYKSDRSIKKLDFSEWKNITFGMSGALLILGTSTLGVGYTKQKKTEAQIYSQETT